MFLGNVMLTERKQQGLTQTELAAGICNQNIISRLEKHNDMPTLSVLLKLCLKLNLTLNDVFSDFASNTNPEQHAILIDLEKDLLLGNETGSQAKLNLMTDSQMKTADQISYVFLNGLLLVKTDPDAALFAMDKVLLLTQNDSYDIYTELAYLVKGNVYMNQHNFVRAGDYYQLITAALQANLLISNAQPVELLFIIKHIASFYFATKKQAAADEISQRGIDFAQSEHVTFFVDELYFYKVSGLSKSDAQFDRQRQMGMAMATANHNQPLRQKIQKLN